MWSQTIPKSFWRLKTKLCWLYRKCLKNPSWLRISSRGAGLILVSDLKFFIFCVDIRDYFLNNTRKTFFFFFWANKIFLIKSWDLSREVSFKLLILMSYITLDFPPIKSRELLCELWDLSSELGYSTFYCFFQFMVTKNL